MTCGSTNATIWAVSNSGAHIFKSAVILNYQDYKWERLRILKFQDKILFMNSGNFK